jgi:hypothetical protein
MGSNQETVRKGQIPQSVRLLNNSNMLSPQVLAHLFCFIETKKLVAV